MAKVLFVDDDEDTCRIYALIASLEKIPFYIALNSSEALKLVKQGNIKAVFLDIEMPKMNGIELARLMRKDRNDILIVFISGGIEQHLKEIKEITNFYMDKPINTDLFIQKLREIV